MFGENIIIFLYKNTKNVIKVNLALRFLLSVQPSSLVPWLSIMAWEENGAARYQTYKHALDIAAFIPLVIVISMANDVFREDDLLKTHDSSLDGITPDPQVPQTILPV